MRRARLLAVALTTVLALSACSGGDASGKPGKKFVIQKGTLEAKQAAMAAMPSSQAIIRPDAAATVQQTSAKPSVNGSGSPSRQTFSSMPSVTAP